MARTTNVGTISVSIVGNTAQFNAAMTDAQIKAAMAAGGIKMSLGQLKTSFQGSGDSAKKAAEDVAGASAKVVASGQHMASGTQAASAGIRVLEGRFGSMVRAAEQFIGKMPAVSKALQLAFPAFGAIAIAGVFVELGKHVAEFVTQLDEVRNRPKAIADAFRDMQVSAMASNAELVVTGDKLQNAINKLEHKPANMLKLSLDEATASAFKLAETLGKDMDGVTKLLKSNQTGALDFIMGHADNKTVTGEQKVFQDNMSALLLKQADAMSKVTTEDQKNALIKQQLAERQAAFTAQLAKYDAELAKSHAIEDKRKTAMSSGTTTYVQRETRGYDANQPDQSSIISSYTQARGAVNNQAVTDRISTANEVLTQKEQGLQAVKVDPFGDAIKKLNTELASANSGLSDTLSGKAKSLSEAYAKAQEVIASANKTLEDSGRSLTGEQQAEILSKERILELTQNLSKELQRQQSEAAKAQEELKKAFASANETVQLSVTHAADEAVAKALTAEKELQALQKEFEAASMGGYAKRIAKYADSGIPNEDVLDPEAANKRAQERLKDETADKLAVVNINEQIAAQERLIAVVGKGQDAQRGAQRANISGNTNDSPDVIKAKLAQFDAANQLADKLKGDGETAGQGFDNFFAKLHDQTVSAGTEVETVLGSAFQGLDDQLAKLVTGQKTQWKSFFMGIADEIAKMTIKNSIIGIMTGGKATPAGGTVGGTGASGALGGLANVLLHPKGGDSDKPSGTGVIGGSSGGGGISGFFSGLLKAGLGAIGVKLPGKSPVAGLPDVNNADSYDYSDFGGGYAVGGNVTGGSDIEVGERGPEMFHVPVNGSITPNGQKAPSEKQGGNAYYTIDARGTNAADVESRVRAALAQTHKQAVRDSSSLQSEIARRSPRSKFSR